MVLISNYFVKLCACEPFKRVVQLISRWQSRRFSTPFQPLMPISCFHSLYSAAADKRLLSIHNPQAFPISYPSSSNFFGTGITFYLPHQRINERDNNSFSRMDIASDNLLAF